MEEGATFTALRERYNGFTARFEVAWELTMAVLAIAFVIIGLAIDEADAASRPLLESADTALTIVFATEFTSRFLASWDRRAYLRGHWIDLVALVPVVRGVRVLRLLRLLRLIRAFAGIFRATQHFERLAPRHPYSPRGQLAKGPSRLLRGEGPVREYDSAGPERHRP